MDTPRRDHIRDALRNMAQSYAATMDLMEHTYALLREEWSLDPLSYFRSRPVTPPDDIGTQSPVMDRTLFTVHFKGKQCFLGNTLGFAFLARLVQRPNRYLAHEDLLADVWRGIRSPATIRSLVKMLRRKLREAGMAQFASAIDGSVRGHYALKLPPS